MNYKRNIELTEKQLFKLKSAIQTTKPMTDKALAYCKLLLSISVCINDNDIKSDILLAIFNKFLDKKGHNKHFKIVNVGINKMIICKCRKLLFCATVDINMSIDRTFYTNKPYGETYREYIKLDIRDKDFFKIFDYILLNHKLKTIIKTNK
jgi:hypothetical protein